MALKTKVYVVEYSHWTETYADSVWSTRKKAKTRIGVLGGKHSGFGVYEYTLDGGPEFRIKEKK